MKRYFEWVVEKCSYMWNLPEEEVAELLLTGQREVPGAYSIDIYIKEVLKR